MKITSCAATVKLNGYEGRHSTEPDTHLGTYEIPEQEMSGHEIPRDTVFCIGVVLFCMLQTRTKPETDVVERERNREREYYLYEEATDIAERIGYAVDHTLTHRIYDGKVYDSKFVRIADYTQKSLDVAPSLFHGDSAFEIERREIEHIKTLRVEDLASGRLGGNAMIEASPAPRAVLEGRTSIKGYRPDLRRDFMRIHYVVNDEIHCRIFSLDNVTDATRQQVGEWVGINMSPGRSDEDIMRSDVICDLTPERVEELVAMTKAVHDKTLADEKGGTWHAGSRFANREGALQVVLSQTDLMREHMEVWSEIVGRAVDRDAGNIAMDPYRKRTAAAIFGRGEGMSIASIGDGGVNDVMASNNFEAGCAIGSSESNTVNDMAMSQGKKEFISKTCPMCGDKRVLTKIEGSVISGSCGCAKDICTGEAIRVNRRKGLPDNVPRDHEELRGRSAEEPTPQTPTITAQDIKKEFGQYAELRTMIVMGGTSLVAYDSVRKEVITRL